MILSTNNRMEITHLSWTHTQLDDLEFENNLALLILIMKDETATISETLKPDTAELQDLKHGQIYL
jgi:hypothetical protein